MTAHCRPETYDDFDVAADIAISVIACKGQGTAVRREIAQLLREHFEMISSTANEPARGTCAEYEVLMAAAKALKRYHHPPSRIDAQDCPCCNCEGERAIAALRAAGIQIEGDNT